MTLKCFLRIIAALLLICLFAGLVSCGGGEGNCCVINGKTLSFVSDKEIRRLRKPLAKLLSNMELFVTDGDDILGYEAPDPSSPSIPNCYRCGLFDVTGDGIPELLVHPFGYHGSSGTATYFVYDIPSGRELGSIDGGIAESWCLFYDTADDSTFAVGSYWLRSGWESRRRRISLLEYDEDSGKCSEKSYFCTMHAIDKELSDDGSWAEIYPIKLYELYGEKVSLDDYYDEYDRFLTECIRIKETELVMIDWDEVCSDDDSNAARGKKMADALLSSGQRFMETSTGGLGKAD